MKKFITIFILTFLVFSCFLSFQKKEIISIEDIVVLYKRPISEWPSPLIDKGVEWKEFESLEADSNYYQNQELPKVKLGKMLFFDPKLSKSNQISCSSCHDPEMGWTDRRQVSLGHDHLLGTRNSPSLLNIAEKKSFFWDGRAKSLEEQAMGPITAHNEMAYNPDSLVVKLSKIKGYSPLFKSAFGTNEVTFERITIALADFQKSIKSQFSRFDLFLRGNYNSLTDKEIYGMHLFRTKARCMNCHWGKYLTDEKFHNIGLTYYNRKYQDLGRYEVTKLPEDVGKFRTPSLRDLLITRPWMHNGFFDNLAGIVNIYNSGMHMIDPTPEQKAKDPLYPYTDELMQPLNLTPDEKKAIVAFLESMSGTKYKMPRPEFPRE